MANPSEPTARTAQQVGVLQSPSWQSGSEQADSQDSGDREIRTLTEQAALEQEGSMPVNNEGGTPRSRAQCEGDVDVGADPTFNSPLFPVYGFYNYSRSMALILRSELDPAICAPQLITHLSIYVGASGTMTFTGIQVRLKKTTATAISTTWDGSGTLVWSGSKAFNATGWYDFDITDFNWDSDNLLITWQHGYTAHANYPQFKAKSLGTGNYRQAYGYSDTALPTTLSQTISRTVYRLTFPLVPGACCIPTTGDCSVVTAPVCTGLGGVFQGGGTTCTPNPCLPPPIGACCHLDGTCAVISEPECTSPGIWHSDWPTCDPNPCPPPLPTGACCQPLTGGCTVVTEVECVSPSTWHGEWTTCDPDPCPPPPTGACCQTATGDCAVTTELECVSPGIWHGEWTTCDPNPCPQPPTGACCQQDGTCALTIEVQCVSPGTWHGEWTTCDPSPCPVMCQGDVEVGTAPFFNTPLFPLNSLYNYSRTMSLMLRSEVDPGICTPQVITHLAIYVDVVGEPFTFANIELRVKKTTATELTSAWDGTGTLVWSGTLGFTTVGWHVFDIADFNWDADNLLITWQYGPTPWVLNGPRFRAKYLAPGIYRQSYAYGDDALPTTMTPTLSRVFYAMVFQGPSGACCNPISGGCSILSAADCLTAGGEFQGPDTVCDPNPCQACVICPPEGVAEGEPACYDDYADTTNSGCSNPTSPVFASISCGETICGTAGNFLSGGSSARDTDWYQVVTTGPTIFTWTVTPTFPAAIGLVEQTKPGLPGCEYTTGYLNPYATPATCQPGSITTACLPAGTYYFFVAPAGYTGVACGSLYTATLTGTQCVLGACCVSTPTPSCSIMSDTACAAAGGTFLGAEGTCSALDCNANGVDDSCDIAAGTSQDANGNGIPDECEVPPTGACCFHDSHCEQLTLADCSAAGSVDWRQDVACAPNPCPCPLMGDMNHDDVVDGLDIPGYVDCVLGVSTNCGCGDFDNSGGVDLDDMTGFLEALLS